MRPKDPNPSVLILPNPPFEATPSRSSPRRSNRACLCKDRRTYSRNCCDGSLQAQGIGNISYTPQWWNGINQQWQTISQTYNELI